MELAGGAIQSAASAPSSAAPSSLDRATGGRRSLHTGKAASRRGYVLVPHLQELRVCVRPFAPHSPTIGLCYLGPMSELIAAGVASLDMLTNRKRGLDAAGDRYAVNVHWSTHAHARQQRYRIWRWMKRVRALQMPGAYEALTRAAVEARRSALQHRKSAPAPAQTAVTLPGSQRHRSDATSAAARSPARHFQKRSGARS